MIPYCFLFHFLLFSSFSSTYKQTSTSNSDITPTLICQIYSPDGTALTAAPTDLSDAVDSLLLTAESYNYSTVVNTSYAEMVGYRNQFSTLIGKLQNQTSEVVTNWQTELERIRTLVTDIQSLNSLNTHLADIHSAVFDSSAITSILENIPVSDSEVLIHYNAPIDGDSSASASSLSSFEGDQSITQLLSTLKLIFILRDLAVLKLQCCGYRSGQSTFATENDEYCSQLFPLIDRIEERVSTSVPLNGEEKDMAFLVEELKKNLLSQSSDGVVPFDLFFNELDASMESVPELLSSRVAELSDEIIDALHVSNNSAVDYIEDVSDTIQSTDVIAHTQSLTQVVDDIRNRKDELSDAITLSSDDIYDTIESLGKTVKSLAHYFTSSSSVTTSVSRVGRNVSATTNSFSPRSSQMNSKSYVPEYSFITTIFTAIRILSLIFTLLFVFVGAMTLLQFVFMFLQDDNSSLKCIIPAAFTFYLILSLYFTIMGIAGVLMMEVSDTLYDRQLQSTLIAEPNTDLNYKGGLLLRRILELTEDIDLSPLQIESDLFTVDLSIAFDITNSTVIHQALDLFFDYSASKSKDPSTNSLYRMLLELKDKLNAAMNNTTNLNLQSCISDADTHLNTPIQDLFCSTLVPHRLSDEHWNSSFPASYFTDPSLYTSVQEPLFVSVNTIVDILLHLSEDDLYRSLHEIVDPFTITLPLLFVSFYSSALFFNCCCGPFICFAGCGRVLWIKKYLRNRKRRTCTYPPPDVTPQDTDDDSSTNQKVHPIDLQQPKENPSALYPAFQFESDYQSSNGSELSSPSSSSYHSTLQDELMQEMQILFPTRITTTSTNT